MRAIFVFLCVAVFGSVSASQTFSVKVPEGAKDYPITIKVTVDKGSTPPPVVKPPPVDPSPPATGRVVRVGTQVPVKAFKQTFNSVNPADIYAFQFRTRNTNQEVGGKTAAYRVPGSKGTKLVEISKNPGGQAENRYCSKRDVEAAGFPYYINVTGSGAKYHCVLQRNQTYYVNVYSRIRREDTKYTCSGADCKFGFQLY